MPSPSAEPAAPAEPSAPAGEEEIDDAEVWNCLPRPARRRQPRVQATIVSTAPAQTSGKGKPARNRQKAGEPFGAPQKKRRQKTLLQRIQRLDLRVLLVVLIVLIIIALIFGAVLLQQGGVVAAMARGTRASVNRTETAATMPGTMTGKKATLISPYSAMRGDSSGVTLELKSSQGRTGLTYEALYKKCAPSAVSITVENDESSGSGTGIVLTRDGYIITCAPWSATSQGRRHHRGREGVRRTSGGQ